MENGSNKAKIGTYLGIDYGESKVGLAIADEETKMAFAFDTLASDKNLLSNLREIIECENVKTVVIGIPSHVNREETEYGGERLGDLLKKNISGIRIEYQNEMFTTKMAKVNLIEKGLRGVDKFDDSEAARIILQEWLDCHRSK